VNNHNGKSTCKLGGLILKTRKIETYKRIWTSDAEKYSFRLTLHISQEELDKIRKIGLTQFLKEGEPL
jgi:hypothetical protein